MAMHKTSTPLPIMFSSASKFASLLTFAGISSIVAEMPFGLIALFASLWLAAVSALAKPPVWAAVVSGCSLWAKAGNEQISRQTRSAPNSELPSSRMFFILVLPLVFGYSSWVLCIV